MDKIGNFNDDDIPKATIVEKPPARPCEYFDLICGTSTGGLNALMLGRLEMVSLS